MQPGATTIPCPHCGAQLPTGARFCGDCGKAVAPTRRAPLPDEVTKVDLSAPAAPSPSGKKRPPLPDEITELDLSTEAAPAAQRSRRPPLPDDITVIGPAAEAPAAQPRRAPLPDDITVVDVSAGAPSAPPRRAPLPDDVTVVDPPVTSAAPPLRKKPLPDDVTVVDPPRAPPAAGSPPLPSPQPVAAPVSGQWAASGSQPAAPPSTQFPVISGNFPLKKRTVLSTTGGKITLVVLVLLIIAGGVSVYFILQSVNRHGLPSDIPLPNNASYSQTIEQYSQDPAAEAWVYTVSNTQPSQVIAFYQAQLPGSGWGKIAPSAGNAPGLPNGASLAACKGSKGLQIVVANQGSIERVSPPSGGVVLEIILGPASDVPDCA